MNNLFDTLKSQLPAPAPEPTEPQAPKPSDLSGVDTNTLVTQWQKKPDDAAMTAEVLKRMQPTISSAINSYAAGMERQLSVKAAKLTLEALKGYDPNRGVAASTYVFHNLKRLNRLGARMQNIIPQSEYSSAERRMVMAAADKFTDDEGREPSLDELAELTGMSAKRVERILDQNVVVNESATLTTDSHRDRYGKTDLTDDDYFEYVYSSVDPVSQKIMEWTAGRNGAKVLSNNQIADRLHISAAAVSQRKNKIQRMLSDARGLV